MSFKTINIQKKIEKERKVKTDLTTQNINDYQHYNQRYSRLIKQFQKKVPENNLAAFSEQVLKVVEAWEQQHAEIQSVFQRESLLQGLTQYIFLEELPLHLRLKIIKHSLQIFHRIGLNNLIQKQQNIQSIVSPKQSLNLGKTILETVVNISKDAKNDKVVQESGLVKITFLLLASIITHYEGKMQKKQKKPLTFQRKSSLKKIQELPIVERPKSKGKLLSLTKKQSNSRPIISQGKQRQQKTDSIDQIILLLLTLVKNFSANDDLKRKLLEQQCLNLLNRYTNIWDDKNITNIGTKILTQITATHRHLASDQKSNRAFLNTNTFQSWTRIIQLFPTSNQIILNILRLFSKLSTNQQCCEKIHAKKICVRNLISFFKTYKTNIYVIIRIAFIFANMTSFLLDIRNQLYFEFGAFNDVYACFDYYVNSQLQGKSEIDKMGFSMAAWDYQTMKKQSDVDALVKIIRLIANIFTVNQIGQDIYLNKSIYFKDLIKKLKNLIEKKSNITQNTDLILCSLSCMANALYYDKQVLMSNLDYRTTKTQIVSMLINFIVQAQNQQICCEGLRVLSNLSRMKQFMKIIIQAKLHEANLILLESSSKEIVYYSLGVLMNLLSDTQFKGKFKLQIIHNVLEILNECNNQDFDIISICLKCLGNIVEGGTENIEGQVLKQMEDSLQRLGNQCDMLMQPSNNKNTKDQKPLQESRNLINLILNNLPEDSFICPVKNCGRKFADDKKLKQHVERRHKLS